MKIFNFNIVLKTKKKREFICLNDRLNNFIKRSKLSDGIIVVFSHHTTFAIQINEFESCLLKDISLFMNKLAPDDVLYFHDNFKLRKNVLPNERKNGAAHLKLLLLNSSQTIPIRAGQMLLGRWQSVFGIELDGPREREISVQIVGK